ncbi:hypothetical protein B0H14DRAFT_3143932 [Mycena olivaceomarginata]|nr:hypothetical protein B0H14DRAFT_3143932 [Mycena olivaceomarginata]
MVMGRLQLGPTISAVLMVCAQPYFPLVFYPNGTLEPSIDPQTEASLSEQARMSAHRSSIDDLKIPGNRTRSARHRPHQSCHPHHIFLPPPRLANPPVGLSEVERRRRGRARMEQQGGLFWGRPTLSPFDSKIQILTQYDREGPGPPSSNCNTRLPFLPANCSDSDLLHPRELYIAILFRAAALRGSLKSLTPSAGPFFESDPNGGQSSS